MINSLRNCLHKSPSSHTLGTDALCQLMYDGSSSLLSLLSSPHRVWHGFCPSAGPWCPWKIPVVTNRGPAVRWVPKRFHAKGTVLAGPPPHANNKESISYFYSLFSNYAKSALFVWRSVGLQWQGPSGTFLFKNRLVGCDGLTVISCSLFMNVSFHPGFTVSVSWSPFHKNFIMTHMQALVRKLVPD